MDPSVMDPNTTLVDLLVALAVKDTEGALDCLEALAGWLGSTGEFPSVKSGLRSPDQPETETFTVEVRRS